MTDRVYQVGMYKGNRLVPAFKIVRRQDGGIRFMDVVKSSDQERLLVTAHFGRPIRAMIMAGLEQHRTTFDPGTQEHFDHAIHELPAPFALMRKPR